MNEETPIRITAEEVQQVVLPAAPTRPASNGPVEPPSGSRRSYGAAPAGGAGAVEPSEAGGFLRRSWVYLGLAGMVGAMVAWAACEPFFGVDASGRETARGWGRLLCPAVVVFMCLGFALAESWVERSPSKGLRRAGAAFGLGIVLGLVLNFLADLLFTALLRTLVQGPEQALWPLMASRSLAWGLFGIASGVVYGVVGRSARKCLYGLIGGSLGAFVGGLMFDPISLWTQGGAASRAVGLALFGGSTGLAMGLVENALKDRWLYVSGGPLAGKQFILYKSRTVLGSEQSCEIYLFKDPSILPGHASIELRGAEALLTAAEVVLVNGQAIQERVLKSGDQIAIGRYTFDYQEKPRRG